LNGVISGDGNICFGTHYSSSDIGTVNINGANTFVGGVMISNGFVNVCSDTGCGNPTTGEVKIYARNPNTELHLNNVTFKKKIYLHNGSDPDIKYQPFLHLDGNNEIGTLQYANTSRLAVNGITYWTGGLVGDSILIIRPNQNAQLIVKDTPIIFNPYQEVGLGCIAFACGGNTVNIKGYHFETGVRCDVNNAFTQETVLCFANSGAAIFDLNSTTQTIKQINSKVQFADPGKITSSNGGLLRVVGSSNSVISNIVQGTSSFECALPDGYTATIMNKNNTSTGDLISSSGKLVVLPTAFWNGNLIVKNSGSLELFNKHSVRDNCKISLEDGANLILHDIEIVSNEIYLNGEKLAPGSYSTDGRNGSTRLDVITGTGVIKVPFEIAPPIEFTWDEGGENNNITTKENWVGDIAPSFSDGNLYAIFPCSTFNLNLDTDVKMRGMDFDLKGEVLATIDNLNNESISLYEGTLNIFDGAKNQSKTVNFNVPLKIQGDTSVVLGNYTTMCMNEGVSSLANGTLVKDGSGLLVVNGMTNYCSVVVSNGICRISDSEVLDMSIIIDKKQTSCRYELDNVNVKGSLYARNAPNDCCVSYVSGSKEKATTNIISGPISGSGNFRISVGSKPGSKMYIRGGFEGGCNFLIVTGGGTNNAELIIEETPINGTVNMLYNDSNNATMVFRTKENYFKSLPWEISNRIRCDVDNIARANQVLEFFKNSNGVIDVNGTYQRMRKVQCRNETTIGTVTDDSEDGGGVLELIGSNNQETFLMPKFFGKVSVVVSAANSVMTNLSENISSGCFSISAGKVIFAGTSSWTNTPCVTVTGGELVLDHSDVFARRTDIYLSGDGNVNLAEGTVQKMQFVYTVDEQGEYKKLPLGTYGSPTSSATYKLTCLTGTGVIEAVGDGKGTMVILK
jgi:hypothetical protein